MCESSQLVASEAPDDARKTELVRRAQHLFEERFGMPPRWGAAAPGRVNLIGEHTDYNGGFVLPMAIERYVVAVAANAEGREPAVARVHSVELDSTADVDLTENVRPGEPAWANYVRGVVSGLTERGALISSLNVLFVSDVPLGAGLSSSAALEVAFATLFERIVAMRLNPVDKARLCQKAEHDFAGVPCGMMDQLASTLGVPGGALLIDCERDEARVVPITDPAVSILVCNTNVRHSLADGEYAKRRKDCEDAAKILGASRLRHVSRDALEARRDELGGVLYRRARHIVSENARTMRAASALSRGEPSEVGALMYESHESLRDDYEVSCRELDCVVELSRSLGAERGVFGARMTGGGFGGSAIVLLRSDAVDEVSAHLQREYQQACGRELSTFVTRPARGAHFIDLKRTAG